MERVLAGKYRLEAPLRSGSMGALYRAHHLTLDKPVCIKIMHPALAKDENFALRFHREARAASRFDHPSSILVLDYGADEDGTLYIAMELVDGRDLFDLIDSGEAFPPARIVDLMSQALAGLAAAHDVGILHRDLKPENIMVTSSRDDGELVKVCDFGIAYMEDDGSSDGRKITRHGFILGTPEYMAPEQARGEKVDVRSDVYAAGCILYHLLTGRPPFEDESALAVALKQISETPPKPSTLRSNVNRKLEAVCLKAMQKDPKKRYATAREMRRALRDAISMPASTPIPLMEAADTLPELEAPALPPARTRRWKRWAVAAAVFVVGVGGAKLRHASLISDVAAAPATTEVIAAIPQPIASSAPVTAKDAPIVVANVDPPSHEPTRAPPSHAASWLPRASSKTSRVPAPPPHAPEPEPQPVLVTVTAPAPTPTPTPTPAPPPVSPAPPPVVVVAPAPAYSVDSAHVDVGAATTMGATAASVERAIGPVKARIDGCYRAALPRLSRIEGAGVLHIETDDVGNIRRANVTGAIQGEAADCIARATLGRRVANVDTGLASAEIALTFRPR